MTDTSDNLDRLAEIFEHATSLSGADRASYLHEACGDDDALRAEVESMLAARAAQGDFLAAPTSGLEPASDAATVAGPPREAVGHMVGRYKLREQIGEGGFGVVWAAEQREPVKRRVALKVIKLGMDTDQVIARFEAERQALALMDHPNIAKVLDAGATESGRPYFVMELVKGVPILDYCDTEKLDTTARLDLFTKVCQAIQHAHQKGIIHRDIKPSNVMVTLHDGVPVPKVIDFGIAKATNAELTEKTIYTQHRQMIGTPAYMSPEQAEMSGLDIDTRSDVYSLGVLLYELLTGTTPFGDEELMQAGLAEMMRIIREDEPHKPSTRLSSLGESGTQTAAQRRTDLQKLRSILRGDLDWIVMKCLEKDRTRRYETANGLAADIRRHLGDEPVAAGPPSTRYRLGKFVKRNRGQVIAAVALVATLVVGVVGTSIGMAWAMNATDQAQRELARATEIKRLITEMLSSVRPEEAKGADITLLKGILDDTAERVAAGEIADPLVAAELHGILGNVYFRLSVYDAAERHLQAALAIEERLLGTEHRFTLDRMNSMVALYIRQERLPEAESLCLKTLDSRTHVRGAEHPETMESMQNLAAVYISMKRYQEAEQLLTQVLTFMDRSSESDDDDKLGVIVNLSIVYNNQRRAAEALSLFERALEESTRIHGEKDPRTLAAMQNLAWGYRDQGRVDEAKQMLRRTVDLSKDVRGPKHYDTAGAIWALAGLHFQQQQYAESIPLYAECIEAYRDIFEGDTRLTLGATTNLGMAYARTGRFHDAVETLEMSLDGKKRVLGLQDPWTRMAMQELAGAYMGLEQRDMAIVHYRQWLDLMKAEADQPNASSVTLNSLAGALLTHQIEELRDPAPALAYATRACAAEEASGGQTLAIYLHTLALAKHRTGDTAGAIETQKRAIEITPGSTSLMEESLAKYEAELLGNPADAEVPASGS